MIMTKAGGPSPPQSEHGDGGDDEEKSVLQVKTMTFGISIRNLWGRSGVVDLVDLSILSHIVKYCDMLSSIIIYCHILSNIVTYYQTLSHIVKYCHILSNICRGGLEKWTCQSCQ